MTLSDLVKDSLQALGVLREGQDPSAEQGEHARGVFNSMVQSWREDGIDLPIPSLGSTTDTININEGDKKTLKCLLAVELSSYYRRDLDIALAKSAEDGYMRWLRKAILAEMTPRQMNGTAKGEGNSYVDASLFR